ncbi:conserved Plasmodium membrane protein, unknown function [Plasmodium sp. gorilla clade G3]|nr:conserved Plasmodium membrane protein, unknown function [Plasmodium sp. gorilla clade G3]
MITFETFLLLNGETLKFYSFFEHVLIYYISKKLINIFYGKYGKYYNIEICSCEELSVDNLFYSKSINFGDSTDEKKKGDKDIWDFFSQVILRKKEKKKNIKTNTNYKKKQNSMNNEYHTIDRNSNNFNKCKNDKYRKNDITHNISKNYNCHEHILYYEESKDLYNPPDVIWNYYLLKILFFLYHIHLKTIKKKKKKCKYDKEKIFCSFCTYIICLLHYENNIIKNKDKLLFLFLFFFYFTKWNLNNLINKKYRNRKLLYHDVYYHHYNNIKKKQKHINIKYCKDIYEEAIITHFYKLKYLDIQKLYNNHFFHIHIYREKKNKTILIICKKSLYFFNHIYLNYLRVYNYSNPFSFYIEKNYIKSNHQIKSINTFKEFKIVNIKYYTLLHIILKYYIIYNNNNRKYNNAFEILYILLKKMMKQKSFNNNSQLLIKSFFSIKQFNFLPTLIRKYLIHFIYKFFNCHHEKKKKKNFVYVLPNLVHNPLILKFEHVKSCGSTTTQIKRKISNRRKSIAATMKRTKPKIVITTLKMIPHNWKKNKKNIYIKHIYYTTLCLYISLLHNNNYYNFYYLLVHILKKVKSDILCEKIHHFLNELAKIDPKCQYIWNAKKMLFFIYIKMYIKKSKFIFQKYKRKIGKKKKLHTNIFSPCNKIKVKEDIFKKKSYKYYIGENKLLSFQNISNIKDYIKEKKERYNNKKKNIYIYKKKKIYKNIYKALNVHYKNNNFMIWKYTPIHFKYIEDYTFDLYSYLENKILKYILVNFDFFIKILECKTYNYMAASHVFTFYNILSSYLFDIKKKKKKKEKDSFYIPFQNKSIKYMFITKYKNVLHKNMYYYAFHYIFLLLYIKKIYAVLIFYLEKYFHVIIIKNMFTYHSNWLARTKNTNNTKSRNRNKEKKNIIKNNYITIPYKMCISDQHIINNHMKDKKYSNNMNLLNIKQNQNYDEIINNNSHHININQNDSSFYYDIYRYQSKNIRNIYNSSYHMKNIIKNNHVLYVYSTYLQFFLLSRKKQKKKKKNYEHDKNQTYIKEYNLPLFLYKKLNKFTTNYKFISKNMIKLLNEYYSENCYIHIYSTTFRNIIYCLCNYNFFFCQLFYNLIFPLSFITNNYQTTSSGKEKENKYLYTHKYTSKLFSYYDDYFENELKYMRKYYNIIKMKYKGQTTKEEEEKKKKKKKKNNNNNNIYKYKYTYHSFNSILNVHNEYVKKKKDNDNVLFLINEKYQKKKKWICNNFHIYSINNDMKNYTTTSTHYSILISYNKMQTKKKERIKKNDGIKKSYHVNKKFEYIYYKNYCDIFFKCIINLIHENCLYLYNILKKYYKHNSKGITIYRGEKKFVHMDHYDNISNSPFNLKECCNFLYKIYLDIFQFFKILKQKNFNFFYVLREFAIDPLKKKKKKIYFLKFFFSMHFLIFLCEYTYIFSSLKEIYKILKFVFNKKFYIPINIYMQRNSF